MVLTSERGVAATSAAFPAIGTSQMSSSDWFRKLFHHRRMAFTIARVPSIAIWGQQRTRLPSAFPRREKYCHNGAWPSPHHHGGGLPGVHDGDHGPSRRTLETAVLQGKSRRVRGSVPFGGRNGLVCLLADARSTATTGAGPSPATTAGRAAGVPARGVCNRHRGPRCVVPWEQSFCRGKGLETVIRTLWGRHGLVRLFARERRGSRERHTLPPGARPGARGANLEAGEG